MRVKCNFSLHYLKILVLGQKHLLFIICQPSKLKEKDFINSNILVKQSFLEVNKKFSYKRTCTIYPTIIQDPNFSPFNILIAFQKVL